MSPSSLTNAWTLNDPQFTGAFTKVRIGDLLVIEGATKLVAVQLSDGSIRWTHGCPAGETYLGLSFPSQPEVQLTCGGRTVKLDPDGHEVI
jgi:hypothetical protein